MNDDLHVPDEVGQVEGYRVFRAVGDTLYPLSEQIPWQPGDNEAVCTSYRNEREVLKNTPKGVVKTTIVTHGLIPEPTCHCGFWMYPDPLKALKHLKQHIRPHRRKHTKGGFGDFDGEAGIVAAKVAGWGRVVEGEDGCRTEFAKVLHFIAEEPTDGLVALAQRYKVPIVAEEEFNSGEKASAVGEVKKIKDLVKANSGFGFRPRQIAIQAPNGDGEDQTTIFLVWHDTPEEKAVLKIGANQQVRFTYEETTNDWDGKKQRFLKTIEKVEEELP